MAETLTIPGSTDAPAKPKTAPTAAESLAKQKAADAAKKAEAKAKPKAKPAAKKADKPAEPKPAVPVLPAVVAKGPKASDLAAMPEGILIRVPVESLVFDRDMQMRVAIVDEHTVKEYAAVYAAAKEAGSKEPSLALPEIRVVDTGENLYVYDGFQRGEALKLAGVKEAKVLSSKGTRKDAEFYALRANAKHGLRRKPEDCRRAVNTVLDDPDLYERVRASAAKYGGLSRAMAAACGVSVGLVSYAMGERGLSFGKDGAICAAPKPKKTGTGTTNSNTVTQTTAAGGEGVNLFTPPAAPTPDHRDPTQNPDWNKTPEQQSAEIKAKATAIVFHELKKLAAQMCRVMEGLAERDVAGPILKAECSQSKVPFRLAETVTGTGSKDAAVMGKYVWDAGERIIEAVETAERKYLATLETDPKAKK